MKKKTIAILVLTLGVFILLLILATTYIRNKLEFSNTEKRISTYMQELKRNTDRGLITSDNYCDYSRQKYSRALNCHINSSFSAEGIGDEQIQELLRLADNNIQKIALNDTKDFTEQNKQYISSDYIKSVVGKRGSLTCGVHTIKTGTEEKGATIQIECSGLAKRAWYPIKEN